MNIHDEITIPGQEARYGETPSWLADSPVWPAVKAQTGGGQLYLHQAMGLELLGQGHNLAISTGTASGKSLVFQAPTLHHLSTHPNATAIAIYPIKDLARDQVLRWQNMAEAAGVDPAGINRIDGDVRDLTERRQILQRTRLALMTPDVIQQWLMAYSEPLYGRRPLRHDLREVQNTQYNVRRFLSNLAFLILDEAHTHSGATVTLQQPRASTLGHLEYCAHAQAVAWERIVGCSVREPGAGEWRDIHYSTECIPEVMTNLRTTATVIIIWEDWFDDTNTRRDVARALRTVMCSRESIHPADIRTTHQNVQVVRDGRSSEVNRAIVIWDKVGGGLGLTKAVADNLGRYAQALLEIARQPGPRSERERLLSGDTAAALHQWAAAVAPHTLGPEQIPIITEYGGVTFRSQLEARWAAYFDRQGIAWEYEPARFDGWTPDFRLVMDGVEAYAEVKPVSEFPMDVAQRILNSGWTGDVFILGSSPRHAWRYRGDGWHPVDLATSRGMHQ